MKLRPVFLGLIAGVAGVVLMLLYMRRFEEEASGGRKVSLLVAVAPIQRGKPITEDMLGVREVPQAYLDDRAIRAADKSKILGLRATSNVPVEQSLAWTDVIAANDDQRDLSALVQPGNRAMPVQVAFIDELPLIHPGDFVDVIAVYKDTRESSVLLQRVLVLATGTQTGHDRAPTDKPGFVERATTLTLSVSLQESQMLALAMDRGRLTVVVRNPDDQKVTETPPDLQPTLLSDVQKRQAILGRRRATTGPVKLEAEQLPK
jgi:pilus assembly protein CpaB